MGNRLLREYVIEVQPSIASVGDSILELAQLRL